MLRLKWGSTISAACAALLLVAGLNATAQATTQLTLLADESSHLQRQRDDYLAAGKALKKNQMLAFTRLRNGLDDYPLQAYLDYDELKRRLNTLYFKGHWIRLN